MGELFLSVRGLTVYDIVTVLLKVRPYMPIQVRAFDLGVDCWHPKLHPSSVNRSDLLGTSVLRGVAWELL